jgi:PiT family inorganic phosphate transporter
MRQLEPTTSGAGPRLPDLGRGFSSPALATVLAISLAGFGVIAFGLHGDIGDITLPPGFAGLVLLGIALVVALAFEFANGFHDTANAAATVIYTHTLKPNAAVAWSGLWNFIGVVFSTGAVAFGIVSLLPVELVLDAGQGAGFAMVFALLLAAIAWNLATWYLGLPASSSHALIGGIMGVGLANHLLAQDGYSGIDWSQAGIVGWSLLISPLIGFGAAALLLWLSRSVIRNREIYREPDGMPPPWWIRILLMFTCTGVSFAHGSNDGQKGMGLIMLILIGTVPTAYALNRSMSEENIAQFTLAAVDMQHAIREVAADAAVPEDVRETLSRYLKSEELTDEVLKSLSFISGELAQGIARYGTFREVPEEAVRNMRNDIYLASKSIALARNSLGPAIGQKSVAAMDRFKALLDDATQFIPIWVKMAVAIALGLGTMVGWKRVVVTVGERIGTSHLTYAQGGSAEVVAMATILAADTGGLPVSTTHVLSSGVAGAMAASGVGLQMATLRNLGLAWVLTLPATMAISAALYLILRQVF